MVAKTLEDGWYVVINAYKFTIFEIWGDFFVYRVSALSLHIESTDSMIPKFQVPKTEVFLCSLLKECCVIG